MSILSRRELPWIAESKKVFGLHEVHHNKRLRQWLISDRNTLGDPAQLPWCGDFVETAIKRSLPTEELTGKLAENPYWARNWSEFGIPVPPIYGSIAVFTRDGGGHVGFLVGFDDTDYYVLGGNQGNTVSVVRIAKNRLLATRWPRSYKQEVRSLPRLEPTTIPKSVNEL